MMKANATGTTTTTIRIYGEGDQGRGAFDGGKITEIKPIPFPHESGGSGRLGPLLYWAWASALANPRGSGGAAGREAAPGSAPEGAARPLAVIGMHPHRGFEIMSYVLEGTVGHTDTAGNDRRVGAGGAQVMQTGSGISHEESMHGERTEFFQIWFEPDLKKALAKPPVYADFEAAAFPVEDLGGGGSVKRILGNGGPVEIDAAAEVEELALPAGGRHAVALEAHHALAAVTIKGGGEWVLADGAGETRAFARRDFAVIETGEDAKVEIRAAERGARLMLIRVPLQVRYALLAG